jgi:hypothetical protein
MIFKLLKFVHNFNLWLLVIKVLNWNVFFQMIKIIFLFLIIFLVLF